LRSTYVYNSVYSAQKMYHRKPLVNSLKKLYVLYNRVYVQFLNGRVMKAYQEGTYFM
jgi:hypothetical protein